MISALVIALLLSAPKPAPAPAAADAVEVKKAKALFQAAQKLYKQGKYADAIAKFEDAYAVRPHPVIFFNIGKCWEQLNDTARALRAFRDYLRLAPDAKDKQSVSDAVANLERRLREKGLQQLIVFADPPTARISVDGKDLGPSPASVELVAGSHDLSVAADGFEKVERSFNHQINRVSEMSISLQPAATPPIASDAPKTELKKSVEPDNVPPEPPLVATSPTETKKGRVWTYVAGGVAVASLGAAIGLGVGANGNSAELLAREHPQAEAQKLHDTANGMGMGANIAYGVAGVAAVTAVILFFVEK